MREKTGFEYFFGVKQVNMISGMVEETISVKKKIFFDFQTILISRGRSSP